MSIKKTRAQSCLAIQVVRLQSSTVQLQSELKPEAASELIGDIFGFQGVYRVGQSIATSTDDNQMWLYIFQYNVGVKATSKEDEEIELIEIKSTYGVEYISKEELTTEEIDEFSKQNVGYHVRPYWREYVQSTLCRMDLPAKLIRVPFYFAAQASNTTD